MDRIKGILLQPKSEWGKIDSEPGDAGYLISNYVAILAAIAPICAFIGLSIIGFGGYRLGIGAGLAQAVFIYVLTLIGFFVMGYIIDFLAGTFGARKDLQSAMKVSAYAPTAVWLAGVFYILPILSLLAKICALYSLYLLYTGISALMKPASNNALIYTIAVIVCWIIIWIVIFTVPALLFGIGMMM
jgi:hypothetical protein